MRFYTPLRYPGGKARLGQWFSSVIEANGIDGGVYVEPYAGGAGAAMYLLMNQCIGKIIMNDIDPAIHAFWKATLEHTESLLGLIHDTPVCIEEWHKQRDVLQNHATCDYLTLGFASFFLNRTNVSGILQGGVIGGKHQAGKYKLNARFNKKELMERITQIAKHRDQITMCNLDALQFLANVVPLLSQKSLIYFDPPYYQKGSQLYKNFYTPADHYEVAKAIRATSSPWITTYDNCQEIQKLYQGQEQCLLSFIYSTYTTRPKANEIMFYHGIHLPTAPFMCRSPQCVPSILG